MKFIAVIAFFFVTPLLAETPWYEKLNLPPKFKLTKYANVPGARQMALSPSGNLYVGTMDQNQVSVVTKDGKVDIFLKNLNMPQGVLFHKGDLYIAEVQRIFRIADIDKTYKNPKIISIKDDFPTNTHHGWKTIQLGPDGKMYVPIGSPCNTCAEKMPFGTMNRMDLDGKNFEVVASGIRNTVGYTWHSETKDLYFTEMGADMMGDDLPPEEINVIKKKGEHFGFPYMHAGDIPDPTFGKLLPKNLKMTPPLLKIQAHAAPIGIAFFPKNKYPKEFHDCFLVAEHGSWNRSKKSGYQITKGCLKDGKVVKYEPFITGFKNQEETLGRPVHFLFKEDGSFFVSDDYAGTVLNITYQP